MENIRLFRRREDYMAFVREELVAHSLIVNDPFYGGKLIEFVCEKIAPLFYTQSDPSENKSFSAYYHFVAIREYYTNLLQQGMYYLHDFTHMLFPYPIDITRVSEEEFNRDVIDAEYAASNETEVFFYYRIPEARELVLQGRRIFYDILRRMDVPQPTVYDLFKLRKQLIESDAFDVFFFRPGDEQIRDEFKSYRGNNVWCKTRFRQMQLTNPTEFMFHTLGPTSYDRSLEGYEPGATQGSYEWLVTRNIRLAFQLLELPDPPSSFDECFEKIGLLEGKVLMRTIDTKEEA